MKEILSRKTKSEEETKECGRDFVRRISAPSLVLVSGGLGAGKTVFVKGMALGLGILPDIVRSPTFSLIHEYPSSPPLYHMDFYRLNRWEEVVDLGFEEYLERGGIVAVEWGEKFVSLFPTPFFWVCIDVGNETLREIRVVFLERKQ